MVLALRRSGRTPDVGAGRGRPRFSAALESRPDVVLSTMTCRTTALVPPCVCCARAAPKSRSSSSAAPGRRRGRAAARGRRGRLSLQGPSRPALVGGRTGGSVRAGSRARSAPPSAWSPTRPPVGRRPSTRSPTRIFPAGLRAYDRALATRPAAGCSVGLPRRWRGKRHCSQMRCEFPDPAECPMRRMAISLAPRDRRSPRRRPLVLRAVDPLSTKSACWRAPCT